MRFSVCWWNTGLAPPKGISNTPIHVAKVTDAVRMLMTKRDVDLLCLGEVDATSIDALRYIPEAHRYGFIDSSLDQTKSKFHMGYVFNKHTVKDVRCTDYYTTYWQLAKKKVAQRLYVELVDGSVFTVFVVHWPSRLRVPADSNMRASLAEYLRREIETLIDNDHNNKFLVLGDFNDEPYNDSIAGALAATRDISMAQKNSKLLYNPFWRSLADESKYSVNFLQSRCIGTYYYAADHIHKWRTFDQMLFSSSLLGSGAWHLNEEETIIWEDPHLMDVGPGKSKVIDHLPIFAVLDKQNRN